MIESSDQNKRNYLPMIDYDIVPLVDRSDVFTEIFLIYWPLKSHTFLRRGQTYPPEAKSKFMIRLR